MTGIELKPCPFCGSGDIGDFGGSDWGMIPMCRNCGARPPGPFSEGIRRAVDVWNTRAALTPPEGYVAAPEDPSLAMTAAGQLFGLTPNQACAVYQSMLAARPEVP